MNQFYTHEKVFFRLNVLVLILLTFFLIWGVYDLGGLPNNNISQWTPLQWSLIKFLWISPGIQVAIQIVLIILFLNKKYLAFPLLIISFLSSIGNAISNVNQILSKGFLSPSFNLWGIFLCLSLALAIVGTILWFRKVLKSGGRWWFI